MRKKLLPFLYLTKAQKIGLSIFIVLIFFCEVLMAITSRRQPNYVSFNEDKLQKLELYLDSLNVYDQPKKSNFYKKSVIGDSIKQAFNPNDLSQYGWEKLGFSTRQAEVIMKYKSMLGGKFTSKEQIRKCYVVSDETYEKLEPFINLPNKSKEDFKLAKQQTKKSINYKKFNPNNYTESDWINLGFSQKQAATILKYKSILGGEFKSKENIAKCYVISDEKYQEMKAFIDLPDKNPVEVKKVETKIEKGIEEKPTSVKPKSEIVYEKFNPNKLDKNDWMNYGFSEKQANTIVKYRFSLGGKFPDIETFKKCYVISEEKFNELLPYIVLE